MLASLSTSSPGVVFPVDPIAVRLPHVVFHPHPFGGDQYVVAQRLDAFVTLELVSVVNASVEGDKTSMMTCGLSRL